MTLLTHRNRHRELDKMRRQRNSSQMKEQDQTTARDLSKMEISYMPDRESKVIIVSLDLRKK